MQCLGYFPDAIDELCKLAMSKRGAIMTYFVKALAHQKNLKGIKPLLKIWKQAPDKWWETRHVPDAFASIIKAEREKKTLSKEEYIKLRDRIVKRLVEPLKKCRFDLRFHIAHGLGIIGGPLAKETLKDLAKRDPLRAIREEAEEGLKKLPK